MGVYIKGIKMPTRCEDCFCYRHNAEYDYAYCNISSVNVLGHGNARLNKCPLVPVTPHGDLIDRDMLEVHDGWMNEDREWNVQQTHITFVYSNDIANAPTIIPAEEE